MPFYPLTSPIDHVLLANERSPGIATVTRLSSKYQWDIRRGFALSGARAVFKGLGLAEFSVVLQLVEQADWDNWHAWRPLVSAPPVGERARAKDIWHPKLEDIGVTAAVVQEMGSPEPVGDTNIFSIEIKFIEYRAPVRVVEVTEGSENTTAPLTAQQQRIEELTGQLQARSAYLAEIT